MPHSAAIENKDRIYSWGRIARFLNVSTRTAQMWEKERGLPVHRAHNGRRGTVFAYLTDLSAWLEAEGELDLDEEPYYLVTELIQQLTPMHWIALIGAAVVINVLCIVAYHYFLG